jgi:hypothetical protein
MKEIITYLFWEYPKLDFILFCDGPIKDAYHQKKKKNFGFRVKP